MIAYICKIFYYKSMKYKSIIIYTITMIFCCEYIKAQKIEGYVYDKITKGAIEGANIYDSKIMSGTSTDKNGYFIINITESDLHVTFLGYKDVVIKNNTIINENNPIIIYLESKIEELNEVTVTAYKNNVHTSKMGYSLITQKGIKNIPTVFGESDVIKSLQSQPGVSAGIEGFAGMYVRGGNDDENLFMIDGFPIYQLNHLGGFFSAFNVEAIQDISFYKCAFPSRYGGRISSVTDIKTKEGNYEKYNGSITMGLTSGNLNIEGPIMKDKTSFSFSLRRSWLELLSMPGLKIVNSQENNKGRDIVANYAFTDLNLKINHKFDKLGKLSMLFYYGADKLKIGEKTFSSINEVSYNAEDINNLNWGNALSALKWESQFSENIRFELSASYTRYISDMKQSVNENIGKKGENNYKEEYMEKIVQNGIEDISINGNIEILKYEDHNILLGVNYINHKYSPENVHGNTSNNSINNDRTNRNEKLNANELSVFLEDDISIHPNFIINSGLRFEYFNIENKSHYAIEPRLSARVLLSQSLSLKSSYSRMNQFVQQISDSYISLPTDFWMPISDDLRPLKSDQMSVGIYYAKNNYQFSIESYYKFMNNLLEYKDGYNFLSSDVSWADKLATGTGYSYGLDLVLEKSTGKTKGHLGYGLMWTSRKFDEINNGNKFPSKYDNRHKLNILLSHSINESVELNCGWTYMTGNRITISIENYEDLSIAGFPSNVAPSNPYDSEWGIGYYEAKNNVRLPDYHRLDIGLNIYKHTKKGRLGIWNFSVYNAYCRLNPIVIQKSTVKTNMDGQFIKPKFQSLAIFPIIPSVSYTYKF